MGDHDLALQLKNWSEKMNFSYTDSKDKTNKISIIPTEKDFMGLTTKSNNDIWRFIIKHFKSPIEIAEIKGNIEYYRGQKEQKSEKLSDETRALMDRKKELTNSLKENMLKEKQLYQLLEEKRRKLADSHRREKTNDLKRRTTLKRRVLTETLVSKTEADISDYDKFTSKLTPHLNVKPINSNIEMNYYKAIERGSSESFKQTQCMKDVKISSDLICSYLDDTIAGVFEKDEDLGEERRQTLTSTAGKLYDHYGHGQLVAALMANSANNRNRIVDMTNMLTVLKDMTNMSFKFDDNGKIYDVSNSKDQNENIKYMVQQMQRKHVQTSLEVLKLESSCRDHTQEMLKERESIRRLITIKYGEDEASAKVANTLFDKMLRYECHKGALPMLERYVVVETDANLAKEQHIEDIGEKFSQMKNFETESDNNEQLINIITSQNNNVPNQRKTKAKEVMEGMYALLKKMEALQGIDTLVAEDIIKEAKSIASSNLIPTVDMGMAEEPVKICDLSINRLCMFGENIQLEDKIHEIIKTLGLESKSGIGVIRDLCNHMRTLQNFKEYDGGDETVMKSCQTKLDDMKKESDRLLEEQGLFVKDYDKRNLEVCDRIKDQVARIIKARDNWWDQPIIKAVGSHFKVDDQTCEHYLRKFKEYSFK